MTPACPFVRGLWHRAICHRLPMGLESVTLNGRFIPGVEVAEISPYYGPGPMTNAIPSSSCPSLTVRRSGSVVLFTVLVLVLIAGGSALVWYYYQQGEDDGSERVLMATVTRGPFDQIVLEQGVVESSSNVDIKCEVKSGGSNTIEIIWVIDEGTHVQKGDKLVELMTSTLERDLVQQQIACNNSYALVVQAETRYGRQRSHGWSTWRALFARKNKRL
jgi:hypothetical protein